MTCVEALMEQLTSKKPAEGFAAMTALLTLSDASDAVYPCMARLIDLMNSDNSFIRTRALTLLIANARWDGDHLIDQCLDGILSHVTDPKPITARQLIQRLPALASAKPELRTIILSRLRQAGTLHYSPSMRPLVDEDIRKATLAIMEQEALLS